MLCLIFLSLPAFSSGMLGENSALNGYVKDSETEEVLIGASVLVQGTKLGSYTNKSGFFAINNIPPGTYKVVITFIGYNKEIKTITFKKGESLRENFTLKPSNVTTETVAVEANREIEKREISISKVNIPIEQMKEIRVGGESDIFRSLQYLPGILTSSQLSSGLFVRGGSPDQNLVLLDGSTVYNPSHLFGFISTFNVDAIKDVELIKGGYPAEFGGRLSAVLNITQKDGNRNKVEGIAGLGIISSKLSLQGPIGNGSWFIGGRRTYFELIKKFISEDPENPIPDFNFYDVNAKVTQDITDNDKLYLSGFMSADKLDYSSYGMTMGMEINNKSAAFRWTHIFGDNLFSNINVSASRYFNNMDADLNSYKTAFENSIIDYSVKSSMEWFISEILTSKFGFETNCYHFSYYQNYTGNNDTVTKTLSDDKKPTDIKAIDWNHSVYTHLNYQASDLLSFQAGLRANYWTLSEKVTLDPRLAVRYLLAENVAIKGAWGIFHQNLRLASMPDFTFFDTWLPTDSTVPLSSAMHFILSLETEPIAGFNLNFDVYYKTMSNVCEINMTNFKPKLVRDVFYIGDAEAYGFEVFLQKKVGRLTGWFGYALGYISSQFDSINNGESFRPKYDRRHDMKLILQYKLNDTWEFGANFTLQSGQSYTGASSRFQAYLDGQNYGRGKTIATQRYGLRLPVSHQLNLNVGYSFATFKLPSKLILDVFNIYNRRDIWFRYYNTTEGTTVVEDVRLLPIIPTLTYEIKF